MFTDREDAARLLAEQLRHRPMRHPIVLGIPRGGVVLASVLARELKADLNVVLARKLRARDYPELAIGAVGEDGSVHLDPDFLPWADYYDAYLEQEVKYQQEEIARRRHLLRGDRLPPDLTGRTVIITDDGVATGSTMLAALKTLSGQKAHEVIVAVPVGSPERLAALRPLCHDIVCLIVTPHLRSVGAFYADFRQVEDDEVAALLRSAEAVSAG